jgi:hypothetical protein
LCGGDCRSPDGEVKGKTMIHDFIASIKEAVREFKHRRALRKQLARMRREDPLPF